ncbi:MAG TPA: carbamoyl-phosphate synthase (glutamine-hydrolyzing) large subunit [Candidatus Bathyarchaeia archaeon]|nr:carbamoyl-phosphate synthase (glutamine-hydrolyzing) large subunit [Candidatus Bathyarchaeia archaeon]
MKIDGIKGVVIVGSGAIKIGEAGEFDYSTSQAIKALREEGIRTIVVNPNIATIHTDEKFADKVYSVPIRMDFLEEIIAKEQPDGILLGFGGQTALNCGVELAERGILSKYKVKVLGTGIESIEIADNRELFKKTMIEHGIPVPKSRKAVDLESALEAAREIGFPVMVRVAYTLGGQGSGVAFDESTLGEIALRGLAYSRIKQVLIEEYLEKWKEVEYEVMRDRDDNCIIICNMENLDPMGIHTGDSIVVAPSQTLTNREYNQLRETAQKVIRTLGIVGECNIQFALDPKSEEFRVIEVNSRLSRSSALASKATGYPIAYIAAKLSLGYVLPELSNKITGVTSACFEPALDYVVVKAPRWDFQKFRKVSKGIGTQMKSVGEVMAIGRCFEEALQKAIRMLDIGRELTDSGIGGRSVDRIRKELREPTDERIFYVTRALKSGISIEEITGLTGIDSWFLDKIKNIVDLERRILKERINPEIIRKAKEFGFSDKKLGKLLGKREFQIRDYRKAHGILPVTKQIDTMAAEWPAATNYLYLTYGGEADDFEYVPGDRVVVLGSGCYRIGSSVEFDWCCVNMATALKKRVSEVIMVNCNPETVSTDFDILDKLYFDELTLERVSDILDKERPRGVVVSVGGQTANNLVKGLSDFATILGTTPDSIDAAEDRARFGQLLDKLKIEQPKWNKLTSLEDARRFSKQIGYPVLIRPSYVLSGSAMNVAFNEAQLTGYIREAARVSRKNPVVISKFLTGAREVEVDGVCDGSRVFIGAVIEHVENAGVHSGDATMTIPTLSITEAVRKKLLFYSGRIARSLNIQGPFNIQFLVKNGQAMVIECNLRASRSMPFVSKTIGTNLMDLAAEAITDGIIKPGEGIPRRVGVKAPQFSFTRLDKADPVTGVEMVSTGEVACFGESFQDAFINALIASNFYIPKKDDAILISMGETRKGILPYARMLARAGYRIFATQHTAEEFSKNGIECKILYKVSEKKKPNIMDYLQNGEIRLVINIPSHEGDPASHRILKDEYLIRRKAAEFGIPIVTNLELARALTRALVLHNAGLQSKTQPKREALVTSRIPTTVLRVPVAGSSARTEPFPVSVPQAN